MLKKIKKKPKNEKNKCGMYNMLIRRHLTRIPPKPETTAALM